MSGFETIGIVLGSISHVIATLENYRADLTASQRLRLSRRELQNLIRQLQTQRVMLQNVCEKLLIDVVPMPHLEVLISDPTGPLWKEKLTLNKIQFRLGKGFNAFEDTAHGLQTAVDTVARTIESQRGGIAPDFRRAVFPLSRSQYVGPLAEIQDSITNLENLTVPDPRLDPLGGGKSLERRLTLLRALSGSSHRALGSNLNCSCGQHVGLVPEGQAAEVFPSDGEDRAINSPAPQIAFSNTEDSEATARESLKSGRKQTHIGWCETIIDELPVRGKEYTLSPLDDPDISCESVISLREILEQEPRIKQLPIRDRLQLAVVVSSSILQLHGKPWLPDTLTSRDIFFFKKQKYTIYSRPFLMTHLPSHDAGTEKGRANPPPSCNPALWSLGVLLIELIFGRTIESLRTLQEKSGLQTDYPTADWLLGNAHMVSPNYETVVKRCLGGELHSHNYHPGVKTFARISIQKSWLCWRWTWRYMTECRR